MSRPDPRGEHLIKFLRVDSRLIHGQIVEGWLKSIRVDEVVIVDDFVKESPFEKKILRFSLPSNIDLEILSVREAAARWADISVSAKRFFILLQSVDMFGRLYDCLSAGSVPPADAKTMPPVNIGLINFTDSKTALTKSVYLDRREKKQLSVLIEKGVEIFVQTLPFNEKLPMGALLEGFQAGGEGESNE